MERHEWLDRGEYPFPSSFMTVNNREIHYIDEGNGTPVLFLHGNPTWSFLYRHLIKELKERHRCVAPDWPGFGLSAKPKQGDYRPPTQARALQGVLDELGVDRFHLIVHDWGGPIGLDVATEQPDRLRKLVVFNSWPGPVNRHFRVRWFSRLMRSPIGDVLTKWNLFPYLMWLGTRNRSRFRTRALPYYRAPFESGSREAMRTLAGSLTRETTWLRELQDEIRRTLSDVPLLLLWGTGDPVLSNSLMKRWTNLFADHRVHEINEASHFVPEDVGTQFNQTIEHFLAGKR